MDGIEVSGAIAGLRWYVLFLAFSLVAGAEAAAEARALSGAALLSALRSGGYVLYFRHMATDFGQKARYDDCANEVNLTDAGRDDARAIGAAIRSLGIPVGDVLASPLCRTRETADLIFGRFTVAPAVRGGDPGGYAELKVLLARRVASGTNLVIVSHRDQFAALVGGPALDEGEAAVIEPRGEAGFRLVARIKKDDWNTLK